MRFNLHLAHWNLLFIVIISSSFIICLTVTGNKQKYSNEKEASAALHIEHDAAAADDRLSKSETSSEEISEEVMPNYKKVKKHTDSSTHIGPEHSTPSPIQIFSDLLFSDNLVENSIYDAKYTSDEYYESGERVEYVNQDPNVHRESIKQHTSENVIIENSKTQDGIIDKNKGLPDISEIPTVTITELPLEFLQASSSLNSILIENPNENNAPRLRFTNLTVDIIEGNSKEIIKEDQIIKINDSGGSGQVIGADSPQTKQNLLDGRVNNIPINVNSTNTTSQQPNEVAETVSSSGPTEHIEQQNMSHSFIDRKVNLTAAEVPIPVFSEWAQKQMEAAEKQALEQQEQTFNNSAQRKNNTNANGKKVPALKMRSKNYASPDCGAKIIASNSDASNTGAVLSASRDEYMLSPCGTRIWFVVEICEAIQAQRVDLANFELFSSSPKNFTVAVANRFPTRDWSNVGRFIAEDRRTVQSFDLHPHLFGKYVRIDIHSHYAKEHFCPVSLFRVFGTSEFEAFETENLPNDDLDDFDDDDLVEQVHTKNSEPNIFKSASDAVLSIVKKAAEVLVKPINGENQTVKSPQQEVICQTPVQGFLNCSECNTLLTERINNAISCESQQLRKLLNIVRLKKDLLNTHICSKSYGIEMSIKMPALKEIRQSYYINMLPTEYIGALCQLIANTENDIYITRHRSWSESKSDHENDKAELALNLTLDKKLNCNGLNVLGKTKKKITESFKSKKEVKTQEISGSGPMVDETLSVTTETSMEDVPQLPRPIDFSPDVTTLGPDTKQKPQIPDVNIFNVPAASENVEIDLPPTINIEFPDSTTDTALNSISTTGTTIISNTETVIATPIKSDEDTNSWENIENLLSRSNPSTAANVNQDAPLNLAQNGNNLLQQQKIPSGPHSESVFIRLSNRIKTLELNMSLSGQYLEELSRRYKKQVEELQQTLTQQTLTVRMLEEQNRRHYELEQLYALRNAQLKEELNDLTLQMHACIVVIIFVGAFVFLVLMVGILFYRSMRRDTKEILALYYGAGKEKTMAKLSRRKSCDDYSDYQQYLNRGNGTLDRGPVNVTKHRRPSEEAMLIIKASNSASAENVVRQRKLSVCYSSHNHVATGGVVSASKQGGKRRGEKHSWPNTSQSHNQGGRHLKELSLELEAAGDTSDTNAIVLMKAPFTNVGVNHNKKKREAQLQIKRQESAPTECLSSQTNVTNEAGDIQNIAYDESLRLETDDLDNFIPTTDLQYNEFMPGGPRGYQCLTSSIQSNNTKGKNFAVKKIASTMTNNNNNNKKSRRLSSPAFFKSPFTKSLKGKTKSNVAHESTSWEWYRLKKSASSLSSGAPSTNAFQHIIPNNKLDSSSLSEINIPTNSTDTSCRMLEEAILSSGATKAIRTTTQNTLILTKGTNDQWLGRSRTEAGNNDNRDISNNDGSSSATSTSNSNHSNSSNSIQSKKKGSRAFNKIFRKVF